MSMIPNDTLVVVADGRSARLFRNVGDESALKLHQADTMDPSDAMDAGPSGSQPRDNDVGEAAFAKVLADRINASALRTVSRISCWPPIPPPWARSARSCTRR